MLKISRWRLIFRKKEGKRWEIMVRSQKILKNIALAHFFSRIFSTYKS
jgi:hypothetical protein